MIKYVSTCEYDRIRQLFAISIQDHREHNDAKERSWAQTWIDGVPQVQWSDVIFLDLIQLHLSTLHLVDRNRLGFRT